ncbi:extracellular solute-binding protein [Lysinibacter cavernae]|uniref:Raffinose/stachyose/melibiose transport system substrate-binding protein n=1 Tax=Lysinibacter cavernae TaxID=1640652 RepID=A0A7X5R1P0_9MICO|nr:extracellular solute-binding protein [Lysinibacter cavernae]NIH53968.1 raffinose/stachyose/melibiose transport system substrate-binding protein [Lysinibacter cavernae]
MIRKKLLGTVALSTALLLALSGCGSSGPGGKTSSDSATMWGLTGGDEATFTTSVESWNSANPEQSIKLDIFANDAYKTKVRTAIGAGQGPTFIYGWGGGVLKSYVDAGQVEDLTDFVTENPEVKERYLPAILDNGVIDGKTYALPNNKVAPVVIYFNKDVFADAGVEPPTTWDELIDLVPVFNKQGIAPFSLGGQSKWPNLMWLQYLTDRIGGPEVFQAIVDGKADSWSDPAVIQALTMIQELVDAGGFTSGFSSIAADSGADVALVYTGKAAMLMQGGWAYQTFKKDAPEFVSSDKLGFISFPTVEGGKGDPKNIVGNPSNFWSISSKATDAQKEAALAYLKDGMLNDEYVDDLIASGAVPVVTGMEEKLAASPDSDFLTYAYDLAKEAPHFQLSWDQALSPAQGDAMLTNLDQIFLKEITPQQFATNMNATLGK